MVQQSGIKKVPGLIKIYRFIAPADAESDRPATPVRPARSAALHTRGEEEERLFFSAKLGPAKFRSPAVKDGL